MVRSVTIAAVLSLAIQSAAAAQQDRVRVIDAESRQPVSRASVAVLDADSAEVRLTLTGRDGFADLGGIATGAYTLRIEAEGYRSYSRPLTLSAGSTTPLPAVLLEPEAFRLDSLTAEARPPAARPHAMTPAMYVLAGEQLARLEHVNASITAVIRSLSGGVRVRELRNRTICVESVRHQTSFRPGVSRCVVVIVDDMRISDGERFLRNLHVSTVESFEYIPPIWAGQLYGMEAGANGALVIWTRGPRTPPRSRQGRRRLTLTAGRRSRYRSRSKKDESREAGAFLTFRSAQRYRRVSTASQPDAMTRVRLTVACRTRGRRCGSFNFRRSCHNDG